MVIYLIWSQQVATWPIFPLISHNDLQTSISNMASSTSFTFLFSLSFTFFNPHFRSFTFIFLRTPSFAFINLHSPSFILIHLHSNSFTFIHTHPSSLIFIYLHRPSFTFAFFHLHLYTIIFLHQPSFTFICLHLPPLENSVTIGFALWAAILDEHQNYSGTIFLASTHTAPCPLSSFDTHPRWQPVKQSARSRRSYGKIGTVNSLQQHVSDLDRSVAIFKAAQSHLCI